MALRTVTEYFGVGRDEIDQGSEDVTVKVGGDNFLEKAQTVHIIYNFNPSNNLYGVFWDRSESPIMTRTNAARNFSDPNPALNNGNGSSPFDSIYPWSEMRIVERVGGTMVSIPKFYYKFTRSDEGDQLIISETKEPGFSVAPVFIDRNDGYGERDIVYVGRYHCSTNYKSVTNEKPLTASRSSFRSVIHQIGEKIWQWDKTMLTTIQMLYLVEYANWNIQATIGVGGVTGSRVEKEKNGYTDNMLYHTGTTAASRSTGGHIQYRYIEDLIANVYDMLDGIYISSSNKVFSIINPAEFSDTTGGIDTGFEVPSSGLYGNIKAIESSTVNGLEWFFFPSEFINTSTTYNTYLCDRASILRNYPVFYVGGDYNTNQLHNGLFNIFTCRINDSFGNIGSRLMELP